MVTMLENLGDSDPVGVGGPSSLLLRLFLISTQWQCFLILTQWQCFLISTQWQCFLISTRWQCFPDINTMAMFPDINTMAMSSIMMMKPKEFPHHSKEGARWIIHQIERDNSNLLLDKKLPLCVNLAECPRPCPPPLATSSS